MVAPATPPPPLAEGDGGGGETNRWCSDALNSVASRTLTTHSSPLDVSDEEINDYPHSKSKVVDDATSGDYYQSVETPRSIVTGGGASASVHSIQIQIDSIHPTPSADVTPQASVTASSSRRRRRGDRRDPTTTTKRPVSFQRKCRTLCLQTLIIAGPPAVVLVFLRLSLTYVVLVILNVVMAFAAWEWNWWSYRIRRRLLLPFQPVPTNEPSTNTTRSMEDLQDAVLNERVIAVQKFTKGRNPWAKYFIAGVIAMVVCGVSIPLIDMCSDSIITKRSSDVGKNVLFSSVVTGVFSGVFCACLTATPADAIILCVYEACFVVSSLNSFLSHHEHLVHDPELLDSMYLLLVGACTIVVWRIVSSKDVMESTLMAMTDILGLGYLVAPMMALSDILGYPNVRYRNDVVGTFFVVVSAAEAAYHLNTLLKNNFPRFLQRWRRPVAKLVSTTLGYESLLLSIVFGVVGSIISMLCFHGYIIHWQDALLYLGAILVSQFCRLALDAMKVMAKADAVKYQPWLSGYMDLVNPYVLAMIVFHPYVKSLVKR